MQLAGYTIKAADHGILLLGVFEVLPSILSFIGLPQDST
jgi:hypothetical protein